MAASVVIALAGCGSKQDANKGNFKAAIQDYYDKTNGVCVMAPAQAFPYKVEKMGGLRDMRHPVQAAALARAGLLSEAEAEMPNEFPWNKTPIPANEYDLTDLGKKYLVKGAGGNIGAWDGFCTGKARVVDVESFTEPAERFGLKISEVHYAYEIPDAPDWAKVSDMRAAYPQLEAVSGKKRAKAALIATSEGWIHAEIYTKGLGK